MGEGPAAPRTPAPHRPTPSLFASHQPPPPAALGKAVHSEGWETQAQKGRVSPLRDPSTPGDLPVCRQSASSGLWGAAHPTPLSSQAAKGKAPPRGHFPFEEPQVEGGVGPVGSWFLSDSGLRFPASWAPPHPVPRAAGLQRSQCLPCISAISSKGISCEPMRHEPSGPGAVFDPERIKKENLSTGNGCRFFLFAPFSPPPPAPWALAQGGEALLIHVVYCLSLH